MKTTWATPQPFFDALDAEFHFDLDVCAEPGTAKCKTYFTAAQDALTQDWSGHVFFMNPPYGRGQNVYAWVEKAFHSTRVCGAGVCLLPASTDVKWFHAFAMRATEIRFIRDRLWFSLVGQARRANHASLVLVFTPNAWRVPRISTMSNARKPRDGGK